MELSSEKVFEELADLMRRENLSMMHIWDRIERSKTLAAVRSVTLEE